MEKLIVRDDKYCVVLDDDNKVISGIISDSYLIKDIPFNNLPKNIFDIVPLYFGKEYRLYNIDLKTIRDFLFTNTKINSNQNQIYSLSNILLYNYNPRSKSLGCSFGNIWNALKPITLVNQNYFIYQYLFERLIEHYYLNSWQIDSIIWKA